MISDNNILAVNEDHYMNVFNFLIKYKIKVIFDNGLDCKFITDEIAKLLNGINFDIGGLRLAFDRIEEDEIFQKAIKMIKKYGISKSKMMAYVLFNFDDRPQDAEYRMRECIKLGIRPYPQLYEPLNRLDRNKRFIGKYWSSNLAKEFRFFYLMAGYYTKMSFPEYMEKSKKLTKKDIEIFHA
jgi:hypothetical protein